MKIFKVERTDKWSYDDYDAFVCFANSEEEARWTAPDPDYMWKDGVYCYSYRDQQPVGHSGGWVKDPMAQLTVTELNPDNAKPEVILASYNAG